jgi:hypothetical protein
MTVLITISSISSQIYSDYFEKVPFSDDVVKLPLKHSDKVNLCLFPSKF